MIELIGCVLLFGGMAGYLFTSVLATRSKNPPKLTAFTVVEGVKIKAQLKGELVELTVHKGNIICLEAVVNSSTIAMGDEDEARH